MEGGATQRELAAVVRRRLDDIGWADRAPRRRWFGGSADMRRLTQASVLLVAVIGAFAGAAVWSGAGWRVRPVAAIAIVYLAFELSRSILVDLLRSRSEARSLARLIYRTPRDLDTPRAVAAHLRQEHAAAVLESGNVPGTSAELVRRLRQMQTARRSAFQGRLDEWWREGVVVRASMVAIVLLGMAIYSERPPGFGRADENFVSGYTAGALSRIGNADEVSFDTGFEAGRQAERNSAAASGAASSVSSEIVATTLQVADAIRSVVSLMGATDAEADSVVREVLASIAGGLAESAPGALLELLKDDPIGSSTASASVVIRIDDRIEAVIREELGDDLGACVVGNLSSAGSCEPSMPSLGTEPQPTG